MWRSTIIHSSKTCSQSSPYPVLQRKSIFEIRNEICTLWGKKKKKKIDHGLWISINWKIFSQALYWLYNSLFQLIQCKQLQVSLATYFSKVNAFLTFNDAFFKKQSSKSEIFILPSKKAGKSYTVGGIVYQVTDFWTLFLTGGMQSIGKVNIFVYIIHGFKYIISFFFFYELVSLIISSL